MPDAVIMEGIAKSFGKKVAVREMSLRVPEGALYGFIGPNGAGKTTTIRMIMSILFPDRGRLSVLGKASAIESKDRIGYLPEERGVYKKMKVGSFLAHMGRLKGAETHGLKQKVREWLARVDLADVERKKCEELSKGMQQKVQFIASILHEPDLIILDEPFSGLDPVNMRLLRDLIQEQHEAGRTVIFSTHVMQQAEQLCDHIIMINKGEKVLDASMDEIRTRHDPRSLLFHPLNGSFDPGLLEAVEGVSEVRRHEQAYEVLVGDGVAPESLMPDLARAAPASRVELHRPSLEDVFIEIVRGAGDATTREQLRASLRAGAAAEEDA